MAKLLIACGLLVLATLTTGALAGDAYCSAPSGQPLYCPTLPWWEEACSDYGRQKYKCEPFTFMCSASGPGAIVTINNCWSKSIDHVSVYYKDGYGKPVWLKNKDKVTFGHAALTFPAPCGTEVYLYFHDGKYTYDKHGDYNEEYKSSGCPYDYGYEKPECRTCGPYSFTVECPAKGTPCDVPSDYFKGRVSDYSCATGYGVYDDYCQCKPVPKKKGTSCRKGTGLCDAGAQCNGYDFVCPENILYPYKYQCRKASGPCDKPAYCSGKSPVCPPNALQPSTIVCKKPDYKYPCSAPTFCTGKSASCPAGGAVVPASAKKVCRKAYNSCDAPEYCDGKMASCPPDVCKVGGPPNKYYDDGNYRQG